MTSKPKILVATKNNGKVREITAMVSDSKEIEFVGLNDLGITSEYEEVGENFTENSIGKALFYNKLSSLPTIADDSGLVIEALAGEPGVLSARYLGIKTDHKTKMEHILSRLDEKEIEERSAYFACAMSLVINGEVFADIIKRVFGTISEKISGTGGFGYDPIFFSPELNYTFGEATIAQKNRVSHRAKAIQAISHLIECNTTLRKALNLEILNN